MRWHQGPRWPLSGLAVMCLAAAAAQAQEIPLEAVQDWQYYNNAAWRYLRKGDYAKAEERFNMAIKEIKPYQTSDRRLLARSYCDLARVLYHEGRYAEAEPLAKWALAVRETGKKPNPEAVFQCLYLLAVIHSAQHHESQAVPLLKEALSLQETHLGREHANLSETLERLAGVYTVLGRYPEAEPLYRRAVAIHERTNPQENPELATAAENYAAVLRKLDRPAEARKWEARAVAIREAIAKEEARAQSERPAPTFRGFK